MLPANIPESSSCDSLLGLEGTNLVRVRANDRAPLVFDAEAAALVAGGATVLQLGATGTPSEPSYEVRATVIPRTGPLAALTALTSGGGELCSATDAEAIVQLNGASPSGTATVYSPLGAGVWDADNYKLQNPADSTFITLGGRDDPLGSGGGAVYVKGGGSGDAAGGAVYVDGGAGLGDDVDGGNIFITSGDSGFGGYCGDISLKGAWNPGALGGGNVYLTPGSSGQVHLLPAGSNQPVVRVTGAGALGFFNSAGTAKPTVSGSRAGNAALASLLTALANMGLITNSSSA